MLLFYRLGGAGGNSPLAVSRSGDRGTTWKAPRILVDYGADQGSGSVKIRDAVYDPKTGRVHLVIDERDNSGKPPKWYAHYCQYARTSNKAYKQSLEKTLVCQKAALVGFSRPPDREISGDL